MPMVSTTRAMNLAIGGAVTYRLGVGRVRSRSSATVILGAQAFRAKPIQQMRHTQFSRFSTHFLFSAALPPEVTAAREVQPKHSLHIGATAAPRFADRPGFPDSCRPAIVRALAAVVILPALATLCGLC